MDNKEFRKNVGQHPFAEQLNSFSAKIGDGKVVPKKEIKGIVDAYIFCKKELQFWKQYSDLPSHFQKIKAHWEACHNEILNLLKETSNQRNLENRLSNVRSYFKDNINNNVKLLTSPSSYTDFLLDIYQKRKNLFGHAYNFLINGKIDQNLQMEKLAAAIEAYGFEDSEYHEELTKRRESEKKSLAQIKNRYEELVGEANQQAQEYINESQSAYEQYSSSIDELHDEKKKDLEELLSQFEKSKKDFDQSAQEQIDNLTQTFQEHLRLKGPVKYWEKRARYYNDWGKKWLKWSSISIAGLAVLIFILLMWPPELFDVHIFTGDPIGIKWTVFFITFLSLGAFLIRNLTKMTMSAFHLARDAEERAQLTHVYLSLTKETNVEKDERQIAYQAIFGRSDTGLLRGDSSPTLPGQLVDRFSTQ